MCKNDILIKWLILCKEESEELNKEYLISKNIFSLKLNEIREKLKKHEQKYSKQILEYVDENPKMRINLYSL